jgi:hypothetical protein
MPHSSMASSTNRLITLCLGAALIMGTLVVCLTYAGMRDGPALSLRELERSQTTLMSCDRDGGPLSGAELLWCAEGDSPLCLPALPASGHIELADAPPLAFFASTHAIAPTHSWDLPSWDRPRPSERPRSSDRARLERPPRV